MRLVILLCCLAAGMAGCANVNAGEAARVSNPSCVVLCFDRRVPGDAEPVPATRPR